MCTCVYLCVCVCISYYVIKINLMARFLIDAFAQKAATTTTIRQSNFLIQLYPQTVVEQNGNGTQQILISIMPIGNLRVIALFVWHV